MTVFDETRLTHAPYDFDLDAIRRGDFSDQYFGNVRTILTWLSQHHQEAIYSTNPRQLPLNPDSVAIGDIEVQAQVFNRRSPYALVGGVDVALYLLRHASGYYEGETFIETWQNLQVRAVLDGVVTPYEGNPLNVLPVLEIRGRYRDFCILETVLLGMLTRISRIATNVYNLLKVANGKNLLFFPARFDLPLVQAADGYAHWLAVQRYNHDFNQTIPVTVSTLAQGAWWGGRGSGTIPHSLIATFLADSTSAMLAFAQVMPIAVPRILLADFENDIIGDSLRTLEAFWGRYQAALEANDAESQARWTLHGVRLDTASALVDRALQPDGESGVNETLVWAVRHALDQAWQAWNVSDALLPQAQQFCRNVKIVVSGGFNQDKIARFEAQHVPVDAYGVGSSLFSNEAQLGTNTDFTMDVVRVKVGEVWHDVAKVGRRACDNPDLQTVDLSLF